MILSCDTCIDQIDYYSHRWNHLIGKWVDLWIFMMNLWWIISGKGWHMSGIFDITAIILLQTDLYLCNTHLTSMH